ncbi:hypothetical protein BGX34_008216, partial [Mortierella sp. NVP85]
TSDAAKSASHFDETVTTYLSPDVAMPISRVCAIKQQTKANDTNSTRPTGFRGPEPGDNRVVIPIQIKGVTYTAFLDSGSTHSVIDRTIAKDLGIKCSVLADRLVELGESGTLVPRIITNDRIPLVCNGRTVEWQVNALNVGYYDFLIGMDLFSRFGFTIGGLKLPLKPREEFYVVEDKPELV